MANFLKEEKKYKFGFVFHSFQFVPKETINKYALWQVKTRNEIKTGSNYIHVKHKQMYTRFKCLEEKSLKDDLVLHTHLKT